MVTPTAFKSNGEYICMPELRYIYQSLINKYNAVCGIDNLDSSELIEKLADSTHIIKYDIHSEPFPLEKRRINGCIGDMFIRINAEDLFEIIPELTKRIRSSKAE